ncbi:MAG TPA: hypothetical protein VK524_24210 [Polyangiaceae bacterium]|nr:hypothetical protein [Polyangiaceae bacterium]
MAAPFESEFRDQRQIRSAAVVYLFQAEKNFSDPRRIVAENAGDGDGEIPFDIVPEEFRGSLEPWGSVALAMTDDLLVIGVAGESSASLEPASKGAAPFAGAVYIYDRASGDLVDYLKAPTPRERDLFGHDVAITDSWLAVSSPGFDDPVKDSGVVYVYERKDHSLETGAVELPPQLLRAPTPTESSFLGRSLDLEGEVLVVGAPLAAHGDQPSLKSGQVFVYRQSDGNWGHEQTLDSSYPTQRGVFGYSVAMSGERFVIGSPGAAGCGAEDGPLAFRGAAYVVSRQAGTWSMGRCMKARTGGATAGFAASAAILGDHLAIGATWDSNGIRGGRPLEASGAAYLYEFSEELGFRETAYLKAPNARTNDVFGFPVALAPGMLVVGAPGQSGNQSSVDARPELEPAGESGAAYVFSTPEP